MKNYSLHIMCSNQVYKCVYPVGGDVKRREKEVVFLGGAYLNAPPPIVGCAARNCQYDFCFSGFMSPLKNQRKYYQINQRFFYIKPFDFLDVVWAFNSHDK